KAEGVGGKTRPLTPRVLESRPIPDAAPAPRTINKSSPAARTVAASAQALQSREIGTVVPPIELLDIPPPRRSDVDEARLLDMADRLGGVLSEFGIKGRITEVRPGPVVT